MTFLDEILAQKRSELPQLSRLTTGGTFAPRPVDLRRGPGQPLRLLTEFKRRSPSAGTFSSALSLPDRLHAYETGGAAMISVLCDEKYFGGSYRDLLLARQTCSVPLLCKEFIIDERQLDAARAHGADAALLIVRCLSPARLTELIRECVARGLSALVEVQTVEEAAVAVDSGATLVGVNARDLSTLAMDAKQASSVLHNLPSGVTRLHLSGLSNAAAVRAVAEGAADGALIGEALMRLDDPRPLLAAYMSAAQGSRHN